MEVTEELDKSRVELGVELGACGSESTGRGSVVVRAERSFKVRGLKKWLGADGSIDY